MINIGYWLKTILVRLKLFCCLLSLECSMLFVWDIVVRIFGGNLFEVVFIYLRLGRLFLFWSWESLVQNFLTLFINWSDLFSYVHYFLNQRHYFKNLCSYQGHLKKLEREENVNIKYKIFKYQKHYFNVKIIRRRKEKKMSILFITEFHFKAFVIQ